MGRNGVMSGKATMIAYYGYYRVKPDTRSLVLHTPYSHFYAEAEKRSGSRLRTLVHCNTRVHEKLTLSARYKVRNGSLYPMIHDYTADLSAFEGTLYILPPVAPTENEAGAALIAALLRHDSESSVLSDWDNGSSMVETEYGYESLSDYSYADDDDSDDDDDDDYDDDDDEEYDDDEEEYEDVSGGRYKVDYAQFQRRASGPSVKGRNRTTRTRKKVERERKRGGGGGKRRRRRYVSGSSASTSSGDSDYKTEHVGFTPVFSTTSYE